MQEAFQDPAYLRHWYTTQKKHLILNPINLTEIDNIEKVYSILLISQDASGNNDLFYNSQPK